MPRIDSKRLPLRLKRSCTDVLNQLTKPQQAPTSSIPGIQVCKSRAGAVLHAQHLTFLDFQVYAKLKANIKYLVAFVRLLWAASRKYNFDLHVLESKAQDAKDRLEMVASQAQKMADTVTEQWIQIQRLEQALHITQKKKKKKDLSPPPVA
ncbi:unnamed protein product [Prunus armeniaca]